MKYFNYIFASILVLGLVLSNIVLADGFSIQASLDANTPPAQNLSADSQMIDLARIDVMPTYGDLHLQGIQIGTDTPNGLANFAEIMVYDVTNSNIIVADFPSPGTQGNDFVSFATRLINNQQTKVYLIRGTLLNSLVSGVVRVGFKNLKFDSSDGVVSQNTPIYGNALTLPGTVATPTPTPSLTPTPSPTPTTMVSPTPTVRPIPASRGFTSLLALNLTEGETISSANSADPDIYIANAFGYKRLFLNPIIFNFYGHLGGFKNVKSVTTTTRDTLVTSGLFRNCETNDSKVYGLEITGEDMGKLHWVNTSSAQATQDDPNFFQKVFCINSNEFSWYQKGPNYISVNQVPNYSR